MTLLTAFWELPMVWSFIIPLGGAVMLTGLLLWDSRIPKRKLFLRFKGHVTPYKHRLQRV